MSTTEQTSTQKIVTNDLWIGGEAVPASTHAYFDDLNPESDRVYSHAADGAVEDIDRAVTSAHTAFAASGLIQMRDRERWLMTAAELFEGRRQEFVDVLVDEVGSPIFKANFEFDMALSAIRAAAGVPRRLKGETLPSDRPGAFSVTVREPVGVVAGITPFNVPLLKGAKQGSMALATGTASSSFRPSTPHASPTCWRASSRTRASRTGTSTLSRAIRSRSEMRSPSIPWSSASPSAARPASDGMSPSSAPVTTSR